MRNDKVIHVELEQPYQEKRHWYFGSKAAIYQVIPAEILGVSLTTLWKHKGQYLGKHCTIREGVLIRQKTNRFRHNDKH